MVGCARELPPGIADGIKRGYLVLGMDPDQVVVVLGQPLSRRDLGGTPAVGAWMYRADELHQSGASHSGATLFRLVFVGGRLTSIEPLP